MFCSAVQLVTKKRKSVSDGSRTSPALKRLVGVMSKVTGEAPQRKLLEQARKIEAGGADAGSNSQGEEQRLPIMRRKATVAGDGNKEFKIPPPPSPSRVRALYGSTVSPVRSPSKKAQKKPSMVDLVSSQEAGEPEAAGSAPAAAGGCKYLHLGNMVVCKVLPGGTKEHGKLSEGPNGFAIATFESGSVEETEVPNLTVIEYQKAAEDNVKKRPAGKKPYKKSKKVPKKAPKKTKKKAKAAEEDEEEEEAEGDEEEEEDEEEEASDAEKPVKYGKEYRKSLNTYGIRKKWQEDGQQRQRQVFAIRGHKMNKREVAKVADKAIQRLKAGHWEGDVKLWAQGVVR